MHRSTFLQNLAALAFFGPLRKIPTAANAGTIMTVHGPVEGTQLGYILPHEHLLVDFIGADKVSPDRYSRTAVVEKMLPHLLEAKAQGCTAFFDCTPAWLGRDAELLQELSQKSGLPIITNTGYYSAVQHKYLPPHAFTETASQLAARWIGEAENGIEGTGIRPGFIKISVDSDPLGAVNKKIVAAAAITHQATGLTIASHTGSGKAALEQLDILAAAGIDGSAFIWVHAQNEKSRELHLEAARRGAWIEFDNLGWEPVATFIDRVGFMQKNGLLQQLLLSHDAGWYAVGEKDGGAVKPFTPLFTELIPALKKTGFSNAQLQQVFHHNPVAAFSIRKRLTKS